MTSVSPLASRRDLLAGLAGLSVTALGGLGAPPAHAAAAFGPGLKSGKAWHSGSSISDYGAFESFRGRRLDTITCWCQHENWSEVVALKGGFTTASGSGARISCGIAPLPRSHPGSNPANWRLASGGSFDGYYTQFAQRLAASGKTNVVVRIGWEINHRTRPWFGGTDPGAFKATWRRIAAILRRHNPTVATEWSNIKKGAQSGSILDLYPGDDVVDIVGVNYYDAWPALNTQAIWNSQYHVDYRRDPYGIGAWLDFAKSRGKRFSCSEWGIAVGKSPGGSDNSLYIENMHNFYTRNAAYIAYENYFNQKNSHVLTPSHINPKASAKYKQLWGA